MRSMLGTLTVVLAFGILLVGVPVPGEAADQSARSASSPAGIMKSAPGNVPATQESGTVSGRGEATPPTDLGEGSERPMSLRDGGESGGSFETRPLALDPDVLEHMRMQDEIASLAF
jgi:hypothetical protein